MLSFPPTVRIFLCAVRVDLRKSFDGLAGCVEQIIGADPLSGHLFVFFNRRATLVKVLMWDRTGYCLYCKRLEQGRFSPVFSDGTGVSEVDFPRLQLLLDGIDLHQSRQRKRWRLPEREVALQGVAGIDLQP
jgi:transposase